MKEAVFDKQARLSLKLVQGAQKVYRFRDDAYYPPGDGSEGRIASINFALGLDLNEDVWDYEITTNNSAVPPTVTVTATKKSPTSYKRIWTIHSDGEPSCSGSCVTQ